MDLITVIVPVYKTEQYLRRCVESICNQTYENLQIILIDDGSPDRCPDICEEMARGDARITVIHQDNAGQGLTRNSGLQVAVGKYVTFLDSDDWISRDHIENLYREIMSSQADAAIGTYTSVSAKGEGCRHPLKLEQKTYDKEEIRSRILPELIGTDVSVASDVGIESSVCMTLYRMELISLHGVRFVSERTAVAEDLFFNLDFLSHAERVVAVNEYGYYYYTNNQSFSRYYDEKRFERTCCFYLMLQQRTIQWQRGTEQRIRRTFLMKIRVNIRLIVNSNLGFLQKIKEIRKILDHELVRNALNQYPLRTYPAKLYILAIMMRWRFVIGVYCLMKLRDMIR